MNDSVKLCIYLCGKDLHFYEKPQEFLPELFYSQFRMTLKIMTASSSCTLHSSVNGSGCLSLSRVLSRVTCCLLNQESWDHSLFVWARTCNAGSVSSECTMRKEGQKKAGRKSSWMGWERMRGFLTFGNIYCPVCEGYWSHHEVLG